jgi:hypothetical protein
VQKAVASTALYVKPISRRTLGRIKEELDVHGGNSEVTTTARMEAVADVRNALSFAVMNACCVPISTPELIINVDATQFTCGDVKGSGIEAAYVGKRPRNLKVEPVKGASSLTEFFIKYYATINANGGRARPIYILKDAAMKDGEIRVHEVTGIGARTHPGEAGFLVFCKSLVPKLDFYKWYIYKPSGSKTATTQDLDAGPLFNTSKGGVALSSDLDVADHWLIRNGRLRAVWDVHRAYMEERHGGSGLTDAHRKSGIHGALRIHQATQRAFHSKAISDSFKVTGLYPFDMNVIFKNCTTQITADEQLHFCTILKPLCRLFMQQGELLERDFDRYNVRAGTADRGQHLIVSRRRCVLLSSPGFWERELQKIRVKEEAATGNRPVTENITFVKGRYIQAHL